LRLQPRRETAGVEGGTPQPQKTGWGAKHFEYFRGWEKSEKKDLKFQISKGKFLD
jgi:hypothetical protein